MVSVAGKYCITSLSLFIVGADVVAGDHIILIHGTAGPVDEDADAPVSGDDIAIGRAGCAEAGTTDLVARGTFDAYAVRGGGSREAEGARYIGTKFRRMFFCCWPTRCEPLTAIPTAVSAAG